MGAMPASSTYAAYPAIRATSTRAGIACTALLREICTATVNGDTVPSSDRSRV